MATRQPATIEGPDWEKIFAHCINAEWKPSNVGLDDVVLGSFGWSAKTVKATNPFNAKRVRLISGRNSPTYSFGVSDIRVVDPCDLGAHVLSIWNERVSAIRQNYKELRTVILVKSNDLSELVVFEFETIRYDPELFTWRWNKNKNLEGYKIDTDDHVFTWQPHGSQFTIVEEVPKEKLALRIKQPTQLKTDDVLAGVGFNPSWIEVVNTVEADDIE
jgi:hypothetical protein